MPERGSDRPEWLQAALIYAAGLEITDPMAHFTDHYGLRPDGFWMPRGSSMNEIGKEVDTMILALSKSLERAQSLMSMAHRHKDDDQ